MDAKLHPDYEVEIHRMEYTKDYIETTLNATELHRQMYKENIKDAMINLDFLDSSQSYISILINTKFIEMAERNFESLTRALKKPYFARIDFTAEDTVQTDQIYIGKTSLYRAEDNIPLIVDWRSPIANVYYEGRLGETSYEAEGITLHGDLALKRQYTIEEGELLQITDVDITTNDAFLQASLEANAEKRLKDIATTIQAEQNRVIRANMSKPLIVQGVAGSGKTTIALHRIAYFIYTYEKTFEPESFMIIAPNRLFINYISEVLPELGVEKVRQTTFIDFMTELLDTKYKLVDPSAKLIDLIHLQGDFGGQRDHGHMLWSSRFKGSIDFKNMIEHYVRNIKYNFVPAVDFAFRGHTLFTVEDIRHLFTESFGYFPLYKCIKKVEKTLSTHLKAHTSALLKSAEKDFNKRMDLIRANDEPTEERRTKLVALSEERDALLKSIKDEMKQYAKKYLDHLPKKDLFEYYSALMSNEVLLHHYSEGTLPEDEVRYLCQTTGELLKHKKFELEDFAPMVFIKHLLFGFDEPIEINSVVIDEAQDFSVFQLYLLKSIFNTNRFTLLGDLSQGIHSYRGIHNWSEVQTHVFDTEPGSYMTLVQSYRTTIEVMHLANEVIKKLNDPEIILAKPVIRHGQMPEWYAFKSEKSLLPGLESRLTELKNENFKSIALIGKTKSECQHLKKYFDHHTTLQTTLLTDQEDHYDAGIVIVPSFLAKGLEFDAVLIVNLRESYKTSELDIKLLYVAMTRALHRLSLFSLPGTMPLLEDIDDNFVVKVT